MAQRGISQKMVDAAVRKGTRYYDHLNKSVSHVLEKGYASGKNLVVGRNPVTDTVTTVMRNRKFNPNVLLPDGTRRYTPVP